MMTHFKNLSNTRKQVYQFGQAIAIWVLKLPSSSMVHNGILDVHPEFKKSLLSNFRLSTFCSQRNHFAYVLSTSPYSSSV